MVRIEERVLAAVDAEFCNRFDQLVLLFGIVITADASVKIAEGRDECRVGNDSNGMFVLSDCVCNVAAGGAHSAKRRQSPEVAGDGRQRTSIMLFGGAVVPDSKGKFS